jgi:hypothetical protein
MTEGIVLALSTVAAYAVAYSFETGYADCFGYPHWLIDVGLTSALTAWITIAVGVTGAAWLFTFAFVLPAKTIRFLVFSRVGLFLAGPIFAIYGAYRLQWLDLHLWEGLLLLVVGGGMLIGVFLMLSSYYRATDASLRFADRLEAVNTRLWEDRGDRDLVPGNLAARAFEHKVIGPAYAAGLVLLLFAVVVFGVAGWYGGYRAGRQVHFWITPGTPPQAALRRYGDNLIVTPIVQLDSVGAREVRVLSWQSGDRSWSFRALGGDSLEYLACMDSSR